MAGGLNNPELEDFLRRVDELESVVQGRAVPDKSQEGSTSTVGNPANARPQREPVDRTVINRSAFRDDADPHKGIQRNRTSSSPSQGQDEFLRALEADANERAEKRRKRKEEATALKELGNREFQQGNYPQSVELYTQGLECLKDFVVLYTNRAQAYNKLDKFAEAIEDCRTALLLEPNNVKAFVHLGKAQQGMKDYDAAVRSYQEILKIDGKHKKMVTDYIEAARLAESTAKSDMEAERLFNEGDAKAAGVHQILTKLQQPHQPVPYYAGGMRILSVTLNDDSSRAQFRTFGGFKLLTDHAVIQKSLDSAAAGEDLASSADDLVCVTLDLVTSAVKDNEENAIFVINLSTTPALFVSLMTNASSEIQSHCVNLLYTLSKSEAGCSRMLQRFDVFRLLTTLMTFLHYPRAESTSTVSADLLDSFIQNKRFVPRFLATVSKFEALSVAFTTLLFKNAKIHRSTLVQSVRTMFTLTSEKYVRNMMRTKEMIVAIVFTMERYSKKQSTPLEERTLVDLIGLLMNIFAESCPSEGYHKELKSLFTMTVQLLGSDSKELRQRAIGLLSRILPSTSEAVMDVSKQNIIPKILDVMKSDDSSSNYSLKCLAVLTQRSEKARTELVKTDKELKALREQLETDSDISIANAALVIGHCTQVPGLSSALVNSDIIKTLLAKTDTSSGAVKENSAITLAKLATSDERHLDRLRELGGIGILHSCMKYIKS